MPIIGIDYEKCINCGECLIECSERFKKIEDENKILFEDPDLSCSLCGHCIAICPENAILYENMGETYEFKGVDKPETIISYDTIYKFLRANRSIRRYKKNKVPKDVLLKVIEAMQCAPTGGNWRFERYIIISEKEQLKTLSDAVKEELLKSSGLRELYEKEISNIEKRCNIPIYFDAPHVIFIYTPFISSIEGFNMGNIVTYGRLAAQALGLGTCWNGWTQLAMEANPKIKKLAKVIGNPIAVFTIGYPDVMYNRASPCSPRKVKGL